MKFAVTVSLLPQAKGAPFVFWDDLAGSCQKAAAMGFDAVEIFVPTPSAVEPKMLHQLPDRHRLKVAAVGTGAGWILHKWHLCHESLEVRRQAREFIRQMIGFGAQFGAPAIIGSMQGRYEGTVTREQAVEWLREA